MFQAAAFLLGRREGSQCNVYGAWQPLDSNEKENPPGSWVNVKQLQLEDWYVQALEGAQI